MGLAAEPCLRGPCVPALTLPLLGEGAPKALRARPLALSASHRMGLPSCRSLTPSRAARQPLQGAFRREAIFGAGILGSCSHQKPSHVCPPELWDGELLCRTCVKTSRLAGRTNQQPAWLFLGPTNKCLFPPLIRTWLLGMVCLKIKFCLGANCQLLCCRGCLPA